MEIVCPSGLVGEVRKLKLKEASALGDRREQRKGDPIAKMLTACWLETTEPGVAPIKADGKTVDWHQALQADRFVAMIGLRVATYGPDYAFDVMCGRCDEKIQWELPLDQLPIKELPPETRAQLAEGKNEFEMDLAGRKAWFALPTGETSQKAQRILRKTPDAEQLVVTMLQRIVRIDGVDRRRDFIENLDMDAVIDALAVMDAADGGIETEIEIECSACGAAQEIELPFNTPAFWMPKKGR